MTMHGDAANAKACAKVLIARVAIHIGRTRHYDIRPRITIRVGLVVGGLQPGGYCARPNDKLPPLTQWEN